MKVYFDINVAANATTTAVATTTTCIVYKDYVLVETFQLFLVY